MLGMPNRNYDNTISQRAANFRKRHMEEGDLRLTTALNKTEAKALDLLARRLYADSKAGCVRRAVTEFSSDHPAAAVRDEKIAGRIDLWLSAKDGRGLARKAALLGLDVNDYVRQALLAATATLKAAGLTPSVDVIKSRRRAHIRRLVGEYASQREFAEAFGITQTHLSDILIGTMKVGSKVARRGERRLGLPAGYLDQTQQ